MTRDQLLEHVETAVKRAIPVGNEELSQDEFDTVRTVVEEVLDDAEDTDDEEDETEGPSSKE